MAGGDVVHVVLLVIWQFSSVTDSKVCIYYTYSYGHSRVLNYNCKQWEYCCSGMCCDYPVLIHRLWYFWVGILAFAFILLLASVTWYKKRYYGRVLRVHPGAIGPGSVHMQTVTTQQFIHTPPYSGNYATVSTGPPPPYTLLPGQTTKHPPPTGPMQPGYLPTSMPQPPHGQTDADINHYF